MERDKTLLGCLEARRGEFCSGEELAKELGATRAAIWKRVNALREQGHAIEAVRNRGYRLLPESDALSPEGIRKYLNSDGSEFRIEVVDEIDSTNLELRRRAGRGEPGNLALIARRQTGGMGRRGRAFYSPDSGLYLSLLLRPRSAPASVAERYTMIAAIAVCEAIEATTGRAPQIKWVNDVLIDGRKVCGILTEAQYEAEERAVEYAVVGIGVNLYAPEGGWPKELEGIVDAAYPERRGDGKNRFAAELLNRFAARRGADEGGLYGADNLGAYRARLIARRRAATLTSPEGTRPVRILGIDDRYRLVVEFQDGSRAALDWGEISVRPE